MDLSILENIVIILALSTLVNLIFTRLRIPTVIGYLMTGVIAGPHLLGVIHNQEDIEMLAEIGVIILLFTIGMEFSLKHLLKIRRIVFVGGFIQVAFTAGIFYLMSNLYGMDREGGLFIGFLAALSSSALVLKILQERSELTSNYGRSLLGILIFQDLMLVPLLLFTNMIGTDTVKVGHELVLMGLKAVLIIAMVYVGNKWLFPKLLFLIAKTRNQELFTMSIFLICFAVALLTYSMGMSLAIGAFLAGLMISESEFSHNAFGNLVPFKDTFTSFFFVSIGMLLDIPFVMDNLSMVFISLLLVILIKTFVAGATGFLLGHTFRGTVIIGLALCQVGEFSFILAKIGFDYALIPEYFYRLFLAVAVVTMALTPLLMNLSGPLANLMLKLPLPDFLVKGMFPLPEVEIPGLQNHLVIIGRDPSSLKMAVMAKHYNIPRVSLIFDPVVAKEKMKEGEYVVYGDAVHEPILSKAHVDKAGIVVISIGNIITAMAVTEKVRKINSRAHIIVRTIQISDMEHLYHLGANQVFPEKLEIAINLFNRVLLNMLYPQKQINRMIAHIRSMNLGEFVKNDLLNQPSAVDELPNFNITARAVDKDSRAIGNSLVDLDLRKKTGATILAIKRGGYIIEHRLPDTRFVAEDIAYILGSPEQVNSAAEMFAHQ